MKSMLYLFIVFLVVCVFGTAACAAVFMLYSDLTLCVVGKAYSILSLPFFVQGAFRSFPAVSVSALLSVIFYSIRHRSQKIPALVVYVVLGAATWFFLVPAAFTASTEYSPLFDGTPQSHVISEGFFRKEKNVVYYYSKIRGDTADGFMVRPDGVPSVFSNEKLIKSDSTYADSLVQNEVEIPMIVAVPLRAYDSLVIRAKEQLGAGVGGFIAYASLALAMLAVFSLQFVSRWRMVNAFSVLAGGIAVLAANCIVSSGLHALPHFSPAQWSFYLNCAVFALLVPLGIVMAIVNRKKSKGSRT